MIKLDTSLLPSDATLQTLQATQNGINTQLTHIDQKKQAASDWESKKNNAAFREIKDLLKIMAHGAQRCAYCEDSAGDEIEHIRPKALFPELCFVWTNYVYACGGCNAPKGNKFAIIEAASQAFQILNAPATTAAPQGEDGFINPRIESSLAYWELDLRDFDFRIMNNLALTSNEYQKAKFTLDLLKLVSVDREYLREARRSAYANYKNCINIHVVRKLPRIRTEIRRQSHPTVWAEIKRQFRNRKLESVDKEFYDLIADAPEVLDF